MVIGTFEWGRRKYCFTNRNLFGIIACETLVASSSKKGFSSKNRTIWTHGPTTELFGFIIIMILYSMYIDSNVVGLAYIVDTGVSINI